MFPLNRSVVFQAPRGCRINQGADAAAVGVGVTVSDGRRSPAQSLLSHRSGEHTPGEARNVEMCGDVGCGDVKRRQCGGEEERKRERERERKRERPREGAKREKEK